MYLIGSVGAAKLLNGTVSAPRELQSDVQPTPLVVDPPVRLQRDPAGGCLGNDGDQLAPLLKVVALVQVDFVHGDSWYGCQRHTRKPMYSPGIKVGRFTDRAISPFRCRIGDLGRCKMEKQLQCGTFEPGSDF